MFGFGEIWAYPTDTSFGLGVRADDAEGLEALNSLKDRKDKFFSLMMRDEEMLRHFAEVPEGLDLHKFFFEKPRTIVLKPSANLPKSKFWPENKVAFRISTISEVAESIDFPITATSANLTGEKPIFTTEELRRIFGDKIKIYEDVSELSEKPASEIWDYTETPPKRIR